MMKLMTLQTTLSSTRQRKAASVPIATRLLCLATLLMLGACSDADKSNTLAKADHWTFVNYWAEWCKPCIKEIPELNALHAQAGLRVLGVNFDGASGDELARQIERLGVAFPTLEEDPAESLNITRPQVLPTTLLLNSDGDIVATLVGPQTEQSLLAAIAAANGSAGS